MLPERRRLAAVPSRFAIVAGWTPALQRHGVSWRASTCPQSYLPGRNKCWQAVLYFEAGEMDSKVPPMREPDKLRERAAQLRALAIKAREDGKPLLADEITKLVIELSDQADALNRGERQSESE
jgi:hypothetical protein